MPYFVGELFIGNDNCCKCDKPLTDKRFNAVFEGYQHDPDENKCHHSEFDDLSFCDIDCCISYFNRIFLEIKSNLEGGDE